MTNPIAPVVDSVADGTIPRDKVDEDRYQTVVAREPLTRQAISR